MHITSFQSVPVDQLKISGITMNIWIQKWYLVCDKWIGGSEYKVPMNKTHPMNCVNPPNTLRHVVPCSLFRKNVMFNQLCHHIPTTQKFHHKVQILIILKRIVELNYPRRFTRLCQNVAFCSNMCSLILFDHFIFFQTFKGIYLSIVFFLY